MLFLTNQLMETFLVYADNTYYKLEYCVPYDHQTYNFSKIPDKTNRLHNILPICIYSCGYFHCIVDTNNSMHCIVFKPYAIFFNIGQTMSNNGKLLNGSAAIEFIPDYSSKRNITYSTKIYPKMLLEYIGLDNVVLHEYFQYVVTPDEFILEKHLLSNRDQITDNTIFNIAPNKYGIPRFYNLDNTQITDINYNIITNKDVPIQHCNGSSYKYGIPRFYNLDNTQITDINYNIITNKDVPIQHCNGSSYKYGIRVETPDGYTVYQFRYYLLVDTDDNCHLVSPNGEDKIFFKLTNDSVVLYGDVQYNNIMIVTNNHIIVILRDCTIIQFELPVKYIYYMANTKLRNLIWSKDLYHKLPPNYKELIRTFMLCNRLMGQFRIPHCVLLIIFSPLIN